MTSKSKTVTNKMMAECDTDVLTTFDFEVFCDLQVYSIYQTDA